MNAGSRLLLAIGFALAAAGTARAEEVSALPAASAEAAAPARSDWSFELNASITGSLGENAYEKAFLHQTGGLSSDFGLDVGIRRALSERVSTGLRIPFYAAIGDVYQRHNLSASTKAYVFPATWTVRFQLAGFLGQSFFNPWVEGEAGLAVIRYSLPTATASEDAGSSILTRPAARGSLGFDVHPLSGSDRLYLSVRASYLAVRDLSDYQLAVGSGFRL